MVQTTDKKFMEEILKISIPLIYEEENNENGTPVATTQTELFIDTEQSQSLVLVGANGAGKTRLGVHIEQQLFSNKVPVQRIAAQRSNAFKDNVGLTKTGVAYNMLRLGFSEDADRRLKDRRRWGQKPATHPLNDYDAFSKFYMLNNLKPQLKKIKKEPIVPILNVLYQS